MVGLNGLERSHMNIAAFRNRREVGLENQLGVRRRNHAAQLFRIEYHLIELDL